MDFIVSYNKETDSLNEFLLYMQQVGIACEGTIRWASEGTHPWKGGMLNVMVNRDIIISNLRDKTININNENIFDIFYLASMYGLLHLNNRCMQFIMDNVTTANFIPVLEQACWFKSDELKSKCLKFFEENTGNIVTDRKVFEVEESIVDLLLTSTTVTDIREVDLLNMVKEWAKATLFKEHHKDATDEEIGQRIRDLVGKIHLTELSAKEFYDHVADKHILSLEQELQYLRYYGDPTEKRRRELNKDKTPRIFRSYDGFSIDGFSWAHAVVLLPDHTLLVADHDANNVIKYDHNGMQITSTKMNNLEVKWPTALCFAHVDQEDRVVLCEQDIKRLAVLSSDLNAVIKHIKLPGSPRAICCLRSGHLVVGMGNPGAVHVITTDGDLLHRWQGDISRPWGLAETGEGHIIKSDNGSLSSHDVYGQLVTSFKTSRWPMAIIRGIAVLEDGKIMVCHTEKNDEQLSLVDVNGTIINVNANLTYKKEYGYLFGVSYHKGYVAVCYQHHVAVHRLSQLFPGCF